MAVTCITNYYSCIYGLYQEYKSALSEDPKTAKTLKKKLDKVNALCALYFNADEGSDDTNKTLHCSEIRALFESDDCLTGGVAGNILSSASNTFTNADLVAGVLTVTHNLNTENISSVTVLNPTGGGETGLSWSVIDANTIEIDFGGSIGAGTYTWVVSGVVTV